MVQLASDCCMRLLRLVHSHHGEIVYNSHHLALPLRGYMYILLFGFNTIFKKKKK